MNTGKNKIIVRMYLKEIRKRLVCQKSLKTVFLRELKERIQLFQSSDREITEEILYEEFDSPDDIAAGFFNREDYNELLQKARKRAILWKIACVVITILLLALISYTICYIQYTRRHITLTNDYIQEPNKFLFWKKDH